eukprot:8360189-Pyramimonas_sp.AAC.1
MAKPPDEATQAATGPRGEAPPWSLRREVGRPRLPRGGNGLPRGDRQVTVGPPGFTEARCRRGRGSLAQLGPGGCGGRRPRAHRLSKAAPAPEVIDADAGRPL